MKLNLEKWLNNKTDSNFKRIFNDNVDKLNKLFQYFKNRDDLTNARINNLVLKSGGDSPNEVVDSRVDFEGKAHETLKSRLDADYNNFDQAINRLDNQLAGYENQIDYLLKQVETIYNQQNETVELYVSSQRGNNSSADGTEAAPFKTIQYAVNKIPKISAARYIIIVDKGSYLEDVKVVNYQVNEILIQSSNYNVLPDNPTDTGHYVRSIEFTGCDGYCSVKGFSVVDTSNALNGILFGRSKYCVVDKCSYQENTKGKDYTAVYFSNSNGNVYLSNFKNQNIVLRTDFTAQVNLALNNVGEGNTIAVKSDKSIIYDNAKNTVKGERNISQGGQIF